MHRQPVEQPAHVIDVDLEDFDARVIAPSRQRPILVDFWAEWCAPCLVIAPHLYQAVEELEGRVLLAKVEVDEGENMKLAGRYKVRGFPTVFLFQDGLPRAHFSSARPMHFIRDFIREHASL